MVANRMRHYKNAGVKNYLGQPKISRVCYCGPNPTVHKNGKLR